MYVVLRIRLLPGGALFQTAPVFTRERSARRAAPRHCLARGPTVPKAYPIAAEIPVLPLINPIKRLWNQWPVGDGYRVEVALLRSTNRTPRSTAAQNGYLLHL